MSFRDYLRNNYVAACEIQRRYVAEPDIEVVTMLRQPVQNAALMKKWMRGYGLFQGIINQDRDAIIKCFFEFTNSIPRQKQLSEEQILNSYSQLFTALYDEVPRSWMSATSKLLWCLYPKNVVIYDAFVHRALVVLQRVDDDLSDCAPIGTAPRIKTKADIAAATRYYKNYQDMVRKLKSVHAKDLNDLRRRHNESYPYDIRILDKLLWMIGSPKPLPDTGDEYFARN